MEVASHGAMTSGTDSRAEAPLPGTGTPLRVLIIDDGAHHIALINEELTRQGHFVVGVVDSASVSYTHLDVYKRQAAQQVDLVVDGRHQVVQVAIQAAHVGIRGRVVAKVVPVTDAGFGSPRRHVLRVLSLIHI